MAEIIKTQDGPILILTISNESKRNAFQGNMASEMLRHFNEAEQNPEVRSIIVTGSGDVAFSSGHDLAEIQSGAHAESGLGEEPFMRPLTMNKPVIAAVNGHCYAASLILALSCDIRVASTNAAFGSPGARLGMLPEGRQISSMIRSMFESLAVEMMFTAKPLSAEDAHRAGFVNRLVPVGNALSASLAIAADISANSPTAVAAIKRGIRHSKCNGIVSGDQFEARIAPILAELPDAKEGVNAFFEKRTPSFTDLNMEALTPALELSSN